MRIDNNTMRKKRSLWKKIFILGLFLGMMSWPEIKMQPEAALSREVSADQMSLLQGGTIFYSSETETPAAGMLAQVPSPQPPVSTPRRKPSSVYKPDTRALPKPPPSVSTPPSRPPTTAQPPVPSQPSIPPTPQHPATISPTPPAQPVRSMPPRANQTVVFNFDNADIYEVIRVMGEILKINYIVDPREKGGD